MKPIAAAAALCLLLQVPQQQAGQIVTAPRPQPPEGVPEPLPVLNLERAWMDVTPFWALLDEETTRAGDRVAIRNPGPARNYAVRAIGRAEDPAQVRRLLGLAAVSPSTKAEAIAQSLHGFDPVNDAALLALVTQWFRDFILGEPASTREARMLRADAVAKGMSHIAYATPDQVTAIESLLADALVESTTSVKFAGDYVSMLRAFEALARVNARLVHYGDTTIEQLATAAKGDTIHGTDSAGRLYAFMALVNARAMTPDIERKALKDNDWQIRRAAAALLAGGGGGLDDDARLIEIRDALDDTSPHVRYEAIRAWGRHAARTNGCAPLVDALKDTDPHVALQAFDLLGTLCLDDEEITNRLDTESETPQGFDWQRPTHAFVALAKRSSEKSALRMEAYTTHPVWWVRMYASFAAAGAKDLLRLDRLAYDENDNVREAAIPHLKALDPERAERAILAALERTDVQLIHTVAGIVKEWPAAPRNVAPLVASLDRLTRLHSMTSRDGRMALVDAIERHATPDDHAQLLPWLRDFDPAVAARAADVIQHLSGRPAKADPVTAAHIPTQPFPNLLQCVVVNMSPGKPFKIRMKPDAAPIAVEQFLKLATMDRYYNGLTIHRVVPNFVIQGGSPGANEYAGYKEFLRDEIAASNVRGSVGLSIRGRNTGDAQFYVNLVDNPRLDGGYTVFATVFPEDMDVVDRIQEGDVIRSIDGTPCGMPTQRR